MKKLLLMVPNLCLGGQEKVCSMTAELMESTFSVRIIVFDNREAVFSPSCPVYNLNLPSKQGIIGKIKNTFMRTRRVRKIRKIEQADYIYSFGTTANLVNVLSKGIGKTIIGMRGYKTVATRSVGNWFVYLLADKIIGCSEGMCETIRLKNPLCANKVFCLYNPINLDVLYKKSQEQVEDFVFSKNTIVSHGRLHHVKNWNRLIKAFWIVNREISDAKLLIIGEGNQRAQLMELIESLGLHDSVSLIGFRENPFAYIAKSSLYVLPSLSEGFPNALIEGMAFLPAISVNCKTGPSEILGTEVNLEFEEGFRADEYGVLVRNSFDEVVSKEVDSSDKVLADAILYILSNPVRKAEYKEKANKRANNFSCMGYREKLAEILEGK